MQNKRYLLPALFVFAISVSALQGQATDLPVLNSVRQSYEDMVATDAVKPFEAAVSALNSKYSAALDRAQELAQQGGKLEEALLLKSEKEEIAAGKGIPPQNDPKTPSSLKQLRDTYRTSMAKLEQDRDRKAKPLREAYLKSLSVLVATLTKEGKLDDALVVKKALEEMPALAAPSRGTQGESINSFAGIPFGTSHDEAVKGLIARTKTAPEPSKSTENKPMFRGGVFEGRIAVYFILEFTDSKLSRGVVFVQSTSAAHKAEFKSLKKILTDKHGSPGKEESNSDHLRAEWSIPVTGSSDPLIIILDNDPKGGSGCKIDYRGPMLPVPVKAPA